MVSIPDIRNGCETDLSLACLNGEHWINPLYYLCANMNRYRSTGSLLQIFVSKQNKTCIHWAIKANDPNPTKTGLRRSQLFPREIEFASVSHWGMQHVRQRYDRRNPLYIWNTNTSNEYAFCNVCQ